MNQPRVPRVEFARDSVSPAVQASQGKGLQQMPASEDDAGIPLGFTARTPGYVPPKEYVQFLDMGGELAKLS